MDRVLCPQEFSTDKICQQLLGEVERVYSENKKIPDDLLSSLYFVFQAPLLSALELVDKSAVTRFESQSGRIIFQVIGASGKPYTCFPNSKFCSCPAYNFSVLRKEDHILCKHILAIRLSEAMNCSKQMILSDVEVSNMIKDID